MSIFNFKKKKKVLSEVHKSAQDFVDHYEDYLRWPSKAKLDISNWYLSNLKEALREEERKA